MRQHNILQIIRMILCKSVPRLCQKRDKSRSTRKTNKKYPHLAFISLSKSAVTITNWSAVIHPKSVHGTLSKTAKKSRENFRDSIKIASRPEPTFLGAAKREMRI